MGADGIKEATKQKRMVKWECDGDTLHVSEDSTLADIEKRFSFRLTRHKDKVTYGESLTIASLLDGNENGTVETNIYSLEKAFKSLLVYGVALDEIVIIDIIRKIKTIYLDLEINISTVSEKEDRETDFLQELGLFFSIEDAGNTKETNVDFCYIPVEEFDKNALDCGYKNYELVELRRLLKEQGLMRTTSENRFSTLIRYRGKPTRVITFLRERVKDYIPKKQEDVGP